MAKRSEGADSRRLTREDWVNGAIRFLSEHSVGSLRLDLLVAQMGVTKGSFYWHFESRKALLNAVLESWQTRTTRDVETWLQNTAESAAERIRRLLHLGISSRPDVPGGPLELSLRDWARRDPRVNKVIMRVDVERQRILKNLYLESGLDEKMAEDQAFLHMSYVIGGRMMLFGGDSGTVQRRRRIGEQFLVPGGALPFADKRCRKKNRS